VPEVIVLAPIGNVIPVESIVLIGIY
jgi:hypothetical protein